MKKNKFFSVLIVFSLLVAFSCQQNTDLESEVYDQAFKKEEKSLYPNLVIPMDKVNQCLSGDCTELENWVEDKTSKLEKECLKAEYCEEKVKLVDQLLYIQKQLDNFNVDVESISALCEGFLDESNTNIDITPGNAQLEIGESITLQSEIIVGESTCEGEVEWGTIDSDVVMVDRITGEVTAIAKGTAVVIAKVIDAPNIVGTINVTVGESKLVDIALVVQSNGNSSFWMGYDTEDSEIIGLRDISTEVVSALNQRFDDYQFGLVLYGSDPSMVDCAADIDWYSFWAPYLEPRTYYNWIPLTSTPSIITNGLSSIQLICELPPVWGNKGVTPYTALLNAINNLHWREESNKIIIFLQLSPVDGLHPANQAELVSGLTHYDVVDAAVENQIKLFTLNANYHDTTKQIIADKLIGMSQATGGKYYDALPLWPMLNTLEVVFNDIHGDLIQE